MSFHDAIEKTFAYIRSRRINYKLTFGSPAGQAVLRDLGKFCRSDGTDVPWGSDALHTARLVGRYEVFTRIRQHLNMSDAQLLSIFGGRDIIVTEPVGDEDAE